MKNTYKIADKIIEINSLYESVHKYCKKYRCEGEPELYVNIVPENLDFERQRAMETDRKAGVEVPFYPEEYLERLAVYREISEQMPYYDTFLFHGSAIAVDGQAYIFAAKSGTGKSTHSRLWRELLGSRAVMVNDDKPFIKADENGVRVYGTPYNGIYGLGENICVPVKAICLLERAKENSIEKVSVADAYPMLLRQTYRPGKTETMKKTLDILDRAAENVALYKLGCNMDISAAELSFKTMSEA